MAAEDHRFDHEPDTALPSVGARVTAFVSILAGGAMGALIGYAFMTIQCDGSCELGRGLGLLGGALVAALGVAVVAVLTLRALTEWDRGGTR